MRIGIDCRLYGLENAGIGRYILNLTQQLIINGEKHYWYCFVENQNQAKAINANLSGFLNFQTIVTNFRHYSIQEQINYAQLLNSKKLNLLYVPHFNIPIFFKGKIIITIHDLLWHRQRGAKVTTLPSWLYWLKYLAYHLVVFIASIRAIYIFVPSRIVADEVKQFYFWTKNKIIITSEGIDENLLKIIKKNRELNNKKKLTYRLVYTGSLYPHKNLEIVLKSLTILKKYSLYIISSRKIFQQEIKELIKKFKIEKRVIFVNNYSDQKVFQLYQQVDFLIMPSISEGFGLTGIEAIASKLPVIASDIPIFHEIYQDTVIYFDPHDYTDLVKKIKLFSQNYSKYKLQAENNSIKIIAKFSWSKVSKIILQNIDKL